MIARRRGVRAPELAEYPAEFQATYRYVVSREEQLLKATSADVKRSIERLVEKVGIERGIVE